MKVYFSQLYVEPGVTFPFSYHFQVRLSEEVTRVAEASPLFTKKYGADWNLIFRISAKRQIQDTEIRGPSVFRKAKDVEFSLFLAYDVLRQEAEVEKSAVRAMLNAVSVVFQKYAIAAEQLRAKKEILVESTCSDPKMFDFSDDK